MRIAVIGVTGLVGSKILEVLEERRFPVTEFIPVASANSAGKTIIFKGKHYTILTIEEAFEQKPQIALFSAGGIISKEWASRFAEAGTTVIDNSSAWRMEEGIKLVVPEVNASVLSKEDKIIANPNCSTIQMVVALAPVHAQYGIKRLVISTYQSVTGTGVKAVEQLMFERKREKVIDRAYSHQIDLNLIPQIDVFVEDGYTREEMKMVNETRKILGDEEIAITATAVRVPVIGGHSESVNVETKKPFDIKDIRKIWESSEGVVVKDDVKTRSYPMPVDAHNNNNVWVGRIRQDFSAPNSFNVWIVSDNLRKGAATNAVQIAEYLVQKELI